MRDSNDMWVVGGLLIALTISLASCTFNEDGKLRVGRDAGIADASLAIDGQQPDANNIECVGRPDGTPCGDPADTECDGADTCLNEQCEANWVARNMACGDPTDDDCTDPDTCDGAGTCAANHETVNTACGDPTDDDCTNPDTCDGAGTCAANHESMGAACGDLSDTDCTDPDTCDGAGTCAANHGPDDSACDDCMAGPGACDSCQNGSCVNLP